MEVEAVNMKKFNHDKKGSKDSFVNLFNSKGFYIILILSIVIIGGATIFITRQSLSSLSDREDYIPEDFDNFLEDYENGLVENDPADNETYLENEASEEAEQNDELLASNNTEAIGEGLAIDGDQLQKDNIAASNESEAVKIPNINDKDKEKENQEDNTQTGENINQEKNDQEDSQEKNKNDDAKTDDAGKTEKQSSAEEAASNNNTAEDEASEQEQIARENNEDVESDFIMPVYGSIIYDFSMDKLAYSVTLNDWRTHKGIDIAASRGTAVKAVADGVVIDVYEDPRLGFTVVIDHENGLKTVYSNLASGDMVVPNQIVTQGESIGSVGNTASFEIALEPHLHFEVLKDDQIVDPKLYLPSY